MASHPCIPDLCRHCRPGRPCAATQRWLEDEERTEQTAAAADAAREKAWANRPDRPDESWYDRDDPYPCTSGGILRDDPAKDWS